MRKNCKILFFTDVSTIKLLTPLFQTIYYRNLFAYALQLQWTRQTNALDALLDIQTEFNGLSIAKMLMPEIKDMIAKDIRKIFYFFSNRQNELTNYKS